MSPEEAYRRYGVFIWVRFVALGVSTPTSSSLAFFHQYTPKDDRFGQLLFNATAYGLERVQGAPNPRACQAFLLNDRGVRIVRGCPKKLQPVLLLRLFDGINEDDVVRVAGVSIAKQEAEIAKIRSELAGVAEPLPADSLIGEHIDSILFAGILSDTLPPLINRQAEHHIADCGLCMARLEVWTSMSEEFAKLPIPEPPPRRSYLGPILGIVLFGLVVIGVAFGVILASITQTTELEPARFQSDVASIELRNSEGELTIDEAVHPGEIISVLYDPHNAPYVGFARREGDMVEILLSTKSSTTHGLVQAPVDLIVGDSTKQSVYVVLSNTPLSNKDISTMVQGGASKGRTIAVRALVVKNE